MLEKYYLVSVTHGKKKTLVQYLINGDFADANTLMAIICTRVFRKKVKYLSCTITEIMNDKIIVYYWGGESRTFDRCLDEDTYLIHLYTYMKADKNHSTSVICVDSHDLKKYFPGDKDDIINPDEYGIDASRSYQTINKISFCGVSLVGFDDTYIKPEPTKIEFIKTAHCPCCGKLEIEEELKATKLRQQLRTEC